MDLWAIAYGGGRWVAAGEWGNIVHSTDRINWSSSWGPREPSFAWNAGVWYFAYRVGTAGRGNALITTDFSEWTQLMDSHQAPAKGVCAAFGEIFGNEGRYLISSTDGLVWTFRSDVNPAGAMENTLVAGVRFRDRLIYVGLNGRIHKSDPWRNFYQEWRQLHFPANQQSVDAISGPQADPDGDGAPNSVEYACGLDPLLHDAVAAIRFDPETLSLHYPRSRSAAGVSLAVELSEDLHEWKRSGMWLSASPDDFLPDVEHVWATLMDCNLPQAVFRLRGELAE